MVAQGKEDFAAPMHLCPLVYFQHRRGAQNVPWEPDTTGKVPCFLELRLISTARMTIKACGARGKSEDAVR